MPLHSLFSASAYVVRQASNQLRHLQLYLCALRQFIRRIVKSGKKRTLINNLKTLVSKTVHFLSRSLLQNQRKPMPKFIFFSSYLQIMFTIQDHKTSNSTSSTCSFHTIELEKVWRNIKNKILQELENGSSRGISFVFYRSIVV